MSEFFKILPRRMPEASLPAHATNGELLITTDTNKMFVGRGPNLPLSQCGGGALPSGAANLVIATPNGSSGVASLRALVPADLPSLLSLYDAAGAAVAALSTSESYTDSAVSAEASARTTADGLVLTAAEAYTDSSVSSEATARATADGLLTPKARSISTTAPLTGGGDLSADRTLSISDFTGDSGTGGAKGTVPAPSSGDGAAHKFLRATGGWAAVAYADVSGTPTLAQTKVAVASNWLRSYDASTGAFTASQPAFSDISGTAALAQGGTNADLSATGGTTKILAQDASHVISARDLVAGDIPSLAASIITSGQLALARGGNTFGGLGDLIYGGAAAAPTVLTGQITTTKKYLSQAGDGANSAAPAWAQIAAADLSGLAAIATSGKWSDLQNATADLTLANGTQNSTFNHTSGTTWKFANTTAATASANNLSPILQLLSDIWSNGADTASGFAIQSKVTAAPNNKTITNSSENSSSIAILTVGSSHGFTVGQQVTFVGLTTATWLNGLTLYVSAIAATTISVIDTSAHGTSASHADTGTATLVPPMELTITASGTGGDSRVMFPLRNAANANVGTGGFAFAGMPALAGFGTTSIANGGLAIYTLTGSSSSNVLGVYRSTTAPSAINVVSQLVIGLEYGDNSAGNSTASWSTQLQNFAIGMQGSLTTGTTNPAVFIGGNAGNNGHSTATSGNQIGLGIGYGKGVTNTFQFNPTSGTATFIATDVKYTVNQTGGANGAITGLKVTAVETAVGGTHKVLDIFAGSAGTTELFSIDNTGQEVSYTPNGAQWVSGSASELITLSTSGATTDSAANLLPANAIIEAVVARVTTTITTATDWKLGDGTIAGRFSGANSTMTAGTTQVGTVQADQTGTSGPRQTAAAKLRITTTGTPIAGAIRVTVFYRQFVAPTS